MNDVKTDLDDAMRMLVALHEEHMGIHEQLDALGVPHVAKRDGQWRLALLTSRLEMAERNLVQERARRAETERAVVEEQETARIMLNATLGEAKRALGAERAAHEVTRKRLGDAHYLLTTCMQQRDAAVAERDEARRKLAEQRVEDGRWLVASGRLPGADSEWHVLTSERWARDEYTRLINRGARPYLCRVVEGPDGGGKKEPEKTLHEAAPIGNAPVEEWVIRWDNAWVPRIRGILAPSAKTLDDAMRYPSEAEAQAALATLNTHWIENAVVERIKPAPTDVDELLRESDRRMPFARMCVTKKIEGWLGDRLAAELAVALRAERARADRWRDMSKLHEAHRHLRIVLAHFSPDPTRGPTVARKAHAFLANEAADADVSGPSKARYAIRCAQKAERDAEEEASRLRAVVAAHDEAETNLRAEVQRLRVELEAEKARHEQTKRDHNAYAQAKQHYIKRAWKAEQVVEAWQKATGKESSEAYRASRVEPSGDVVERLRQIFVDAQSTEAANPDLDPDDNPAFGKALDLAGIRAVLVKVAEMVPSEEELTGLISYSDLDDDRRKYKAYGGHDIADLRELLERQSRAVRSLILSRLGLTHTNTPAEPAQYKAPNEEWLIAIRDENGRAEYYTFKDDPREMFQTMSCAPGGHVRLCRVVKTKGGAK